MGDAAAHAPPGSSSAAARAAAVSAAASARGSSLSAVGLSLHHAVTRAAAEVKAAAPEARSLMERARAEVKAAAPEARSLLERAKAEVKAAAPVAKSFVRDAVGKAEALLSEEPSKKVSYEDMMAAMAAEEEELRRRRALSKSGVNGASTLSSALSPPTRPRPCAGAQMASSATGTASPAASAQPTAMCAGGTFWDSPAAAALAPSSAPGNGGAAQGAESAYDVAYRDAMRHYKAGAHAEAEELFRSALELCPVNDPQAAVVCNNLAATLEKLERPREAEDLYVRAIGICEAKMAPDHPRLRHIRTKLQALRDTLALEVAT